MAAGDVKLVFATSASLTITLANLASSATAGRESTAVVNTSNLYLDALVMPTLNLTTGTIGNDKAAYIYAYASEDGTNYTHPATGSDAAITLTDPTHMALIGIVPLLAQSTAYKGGPFSVAKAFGGILPPKWGIIVRNYSGIALAASGSSVTWSGVYNNVAAA